MKVTHILVPVDFSSSSDAALSFATALAKESQAELHLVHVSEQPLPITEGFAGYAPPVDVTAERESLKKVLPKHPSVKYRHELLIGDAATCLVEYAKDHHVDLIVMGTHGRKGLTRLLMGSVAEAVVRRASCPVLTLKEPVPEMAESSA